MILTRLLGRLALKAELLAAVSSSSSPILLSSSSSRVKQATVVLAHQFLSTSRASAANILAQTSATTPPPPPISDASVITIEDSCLKRLKEILDKPEEEFLRINVETGGCSGFSYMFCIEQRDNLDPEEDLIFEREAYRIVINREILPYMKGAAIEYNESLIKSSFQVKNPIAETKCSCGASFSIDPKKIK